MPWAAATISLGTTPHVLACFRLTARRRFSSELCFVTDSIPWVQEETVKLLGINFHTKVFIFWKAPENGA